MKLKVTDIMKTGSLRINISALLCISIMFMMAMGCSDNLDGTTYHVTDRLTIVQTLEAHPEDFSIYLEILEKTGYLTTLQSYGSYSCFVPVNSVWESYIPERWQVNSVSDLNTAEQIEELKELVKFHTVSKKKWASGFIEGRLSDTTYTGDFLTTSYLLGGGIGNVIINREAKLLNYDISADNGIIHAIDHVLTPYHDAVPTTIENTGKHNIFAEALHKTGYFETLSELRTDEGGKLNFTLFIESDSVYALSGIHSFDDLAAKFADSTDYLNVENGLNRFVAYHCTQAFLYSADMPDEGFLSTVLANNAIKIIKTDKELKINETETGINDSWISLVKEYSNLPAKNGVFHTVDTLMDVFTPLAKHVIFDVVSDQPEVQSKLVASHAYVPPSTYANVRWYPESINLRYMRQSSMSANQYTTFSLANCIWYEFDTPVLPKGKYEFLICGNAGNSARGQYQIYWDGQPIGAVYDATLNASGIGFPDSVAMEAKGWRRGKKEYVNKYGQSAYDLSNWSRFIITKELLCSEQKSHTIRIYNVRAGAIGMDYFEWIPVTE